MMQCPPEEYYRESKNSKIYAIADFEWSEVSATYNILSLMNNVPKRENTKHYEERFKYSQCTWRLNSFKS